MEGKNQFFVVSDPKQSSSAMRKWWKEAVVYQIYPRSFKDSNNDGVGDIRGITSKLDYLQTLGVDVVWLSPVYRSPNDDNGYDISDYCAIMEEFGTMSDWEEMLQEMHKRGIKLVMDLVLNHTSDEHPWFVKSRSSKDLQTNPYRDYYIWRPGKADGKEPNNWVSFFGGSAWQFDAHTGEYYLHLFSKKQPDLNWENPQVRQELHKMIQFWLAKGVDGFRLDVINVISKVPQFPDAAVQDPEQMYHWAGEHFFNGPKFMDYMRELKEQVLDHHDIFTVGETPDVTPAQGQRFTCAHHGVLNMLFQFELMVVDSEPGKLKWHHQPWQLSAIKDVMTRWQEGLHTGWNSLYLENHDQPRSLSRFGYDPALDLKSDSQMRSLSAKMLATWLHLFRGTPYIYQGQEIGMSNVKFESIHDYRDLESINYYRYEMQRGQLSESEIMQRIHHKSRDNARTPMQWHARDEQAGFSSVTPWIKVNPNYRHVNVETALADPHSIFYHYQKLIRLRKEHVHVAVYGDYTLIGEDHPHVYGYLRSAREGQKQQLLVLVNFSVHSTSICLSAKDRLKLLQPIHECLMLLNNYPHSADAADIDADADTSQHQHQPQQPQQPQQPLDDNNKQDGMDFTRPILLRPYEAVVYKLTAAPFVLYS